ncbi:MAG TPA: carboxypeptidase M32, partial [Acidobacteriota bacterium]|nr:carboxypeptidase M32 [Acidobacteriota bacterium]
MEQQAALKKLLERSEELEALRGIMDGLAWDQEVMMPKKGGPHRARQISALASMRHERLTDPELGELLQELSQSEGLDEWDAASVRELKRDYDKAVRLPSELVRELALTGSLAYEAWVEAREDSNFPAFSPHLEKMVNLKRREAECLLDGGARRGGSSDGRSEEGAYPGRASQSDGLTGGHSQGQAGGNDASAAEPQESSSAKGAALYDALHDTYEPGMTSAQLDELFAVLRPRLSNLLRGIQDSPNQPDRRLLERPVAIGVQREFGRSVLSDMGFDWQAGRLDISPHPFCVGISPLDVRMTTRYSEKELTKAFFGMIHECGHGLYEQGLEASRFGQPVMSAVSLGVHESQSRLWENVIARGRAFWSHWLPKLAEKSLNFSDVGLDDWVHAVNLVEASFIRVEADEVTYGLHIILRYEIEKALVAGDLEVEDLEEVWNDTMDEYLGIRPRDAAQGVLQDTHWSQGLVGYFPTYLLGNVYAAQLHARAQEEITDLDSQIATGQMGSLLDWLREKIHRQGSLHEPVPLITRATGST